MHRFKKHIHEIEERQRTCMNKITSFLLLVVAIIHLLLLSGALGAERLFSLYGLAFDEPNLAILMRHRAVLLGLLGVFFTYAAFRPAIQPLAFIAGFVSVASFHLKGLET